MAEGYFTDQSWVRRVHRENVVAFAGPRALLMQAAHPVAFAGFFAHSGALDEPYERLNRTAAVMNEIAFGSKKEADRMTRRVRAMHGRVSGELSDPAGRFPAGTPYAADDPELLLWVLATLVDSAVIVYERYVGRMDRAAYWDEYKTFGRLFGLQDSEMPDSWRDFEDYFDGMLASGDLVLTPDARELGIRIVLRPPVPLAVRPLLELANFITVGLLPDPIRRQYGFSWDPVRGLAVASGAEYLRRVVVPLLPSKLRYTPSARAA